jgi:two-component system chemotaxis response regulator CheY
MSKTVLIVEDSGSFRMVVKIGLERAGYQVIEAADGEQACALLDGQAIHLVICDLNMPVMDGLTFVRYMRTTAYEFTPVIMLTTESQEQKKAESGRIGDWHPCLGHQTISALAVD